MSTKHISTGSKMLWITLVLFMVGEAVAQIDFLRPCPPVQIVTNFTLEAYMGKWFEAKKFANPDKPREKCVTANYRLMEDRSVMMKNSVITKYGQTSSVTGNAKLDGKPTDAKFTLKVTQNGFTVSAPYLVLGTDYINWAVAWSCTYAYQISTRNCWIYTRLRHPPAWVLQNAYQVLRKNNIKIEDLLDTDQKHCPRFY